MDEKHDFDRLGSVETKAAPPKKAAPKINPVSPRVKATVPMHGVVSTVGSNALALVGESPKRRISAVIPSTVSVTLDGKGVSLAELKAGDSVVFTSADDGSITKVEAKRNKT